MMRLLKLAGLVAFVLLVAYLIYSPADPFAHAIRHALFYQIQPLAKLPVIALVLVLYKVPTIIAACRRHPDTPSLMTFNLLLGWTVAGWLVSLGWAVLPVARPVPVPVRAARPS
jgi:hypothetical protein